MKVAVYISFIIILFSCKKAEDRTCLKSSGKESFIIQNLPSFNALRLNKNLDFTLVQDDSNYFKITGGEHLLKFIEWFQYDENTIEISNKNKCNFLRDLSKFIHVEIHFKDLKEIEYAGSGLLNNQDTLKLDDLYFIILSSSGSIDFNVNINSIKGEVTDGSGDFKLSGFANDAIIYIRDKGFCNTEKLEVKNNLSVINKSPANIYINANNTYLSGFISNNGNVFYKGKPISINVEEISKGSFISY